MGKRCEAKEFRPPPGVPSGDHRWGKSAKRWEGEGGLRVPRLDVPLKAARGETPLCVLSASEWASLAKSPPPVVLEVFGQGRILKRMKALNTDGCHSGNRRSFWGISVMRLLCKPVVTQNFRKQLLDHEKLWGAKVEFNAYFLTFIAHFQILKNLIYNIKNSITIFKNEIKILENELSVLKFNC